jgi:protein-disulfide isomerase
MRQAVLKEQNQMDAAKPLNRGSNRQQQNMIIIVIIAVVAVIAAVAFIFLSNNASRGSGVDYSTIPQERLADGGFILGNPDAPITVIEFADFACPHCQEYHETTSRFIREYVATGKARFEYRMFPVVDPTYSLYTGQLAECSAELKPGSFWQAHDILFELGSRGRFNESTARTLADRLGLNYSQLLNCAQEATQVETDFQLGQSLGVQGTPAVMVRYGDSTPQWINFGGQTLSRGAVPYNVLQAVVDNLNQGA